MGMIRCPVHGLTYVQLCCEHLGDALTANRAEHANPVIDPHGVPIVLCDACFPKAQRPPGAAATSLLVEEDVGLDLHAPCSEDFKDWYTATGQGDLSARIAQIKAAVVQPPDSSLTSS